MKNNIKEFLNQKANVTKGEYIAITVVSLAQSAWMINDMMKDHKGRTTAIGIAKRKWQVAEDELTLFERKMKKLYGRKYDFSQNEQWKKLKQETVDTFKAWYLMDTDEKIAKLKATKVKKLAKLKEARAEVEQY